MVVCKCRKATKLYCFVHRVPVCGECICADEHQICVVRTYSEWVIDGDYDWPPKCNICRGVLQHAEVAVTRLGCLHVFHGECFARHLRGFPPHTAPAGYNCPECLAPIWPPKSIKDYNCSLILKLKEVISQNGLNKALLGTDTVGVQPTATPPAFDSTPLSEVALEPTVPHHDANGTPQLNSLDSSNLKGEAVNDMIDNGPHSLAGLPKMGSPSAMNPGTMTRKTSYRADKTGLAYAEHEDREDDDGGRRKYSRRGPLQNQAFKYLLPFWSNALPTLPVTTLSRKDDHSFSIAEEIIEGRPRRRPSRGSGVNIKKILLVVAIMSCMATMMLLYYRLLQGNLSEDLGQFSNNNQVAEGKLQ